jgi:hypothetical protein
LELQYIEMPAQWALCHIYMAVTHQVFSEHPEEVRITPSQAHYNFSIRVSWYRFLPCEFLNLSTSPTHFWLLLGLLFNKTPTYFLSNPNPKTPTGLMSISHWVLWEDVRDWKQKKSELVQSKRVSRIPTPAFLTSQYILTFFQDGLSPRNLKSLGQPSRDTKSLHSLSLALGSKST